MAKSFAPRVAKRKRKVQDLSDKLPRDLLNWGSDSLLHGAQLHEIRLKLIKVKEQVRTKFNDNSIKDLAENIRVNGLIQPLVVHKEKTTYTLICGERRFRAMSLIEKEKAPCFILSGKTEEELMAIQFSENSAREELHYIDKADGILNYQQATKSSERKIQKALGISKSEVHRSLLIAKLPEKLKKAAKNFDIEKYVLLELEALDNEKLKTKIEADVLGGRITKRAELKKILSKNGVRKKASAAKKVVKKVTLSKEISTADLLAAMKDKSKELGIDKKTEKLFKQIMEDNKKSL